MLAFEVSAGKIDAIEARYRSKHPALLVRQESPSVVEYPSEGFRVLDVYAYYRGEVGESEAETGTVLRFVQRVGDVGSAVLPGVEPVKAAFCGTSCGAYFDHWVSNVVSRTGFLQVHTRTHALARAHTRTHTHTHKHKLLGLSFTPMNLTRVIFHAQSKVASPICHSASESWLTHARSLTVSRTRFADTSRHA